MLRNWVTQFGFDAGPRAGAEKISESDRGKFIDQIGAYFGWNPPPRYNWAVEVAKDDDGKYVVAFMRYVTPDEEARLLGTNFEKKSCPCVCGKCNPTPPDAPQE